MAVWRSSNRASVLVSRRIIVPLTSACLSLALVQVWSAVIGSNASPSSRSASISQTNIHLSQMAASGLRAKPSSKIQDGRLVDPEKCRFYLAKSAIPQGGLGIFVGRQGLRKGDMIAMPDICIYVPDMDYDNMQDWMHLRTHTWGRGNFFGQFEGRHNRAACEGVVTTLNTMPDHLINARIVSHSMPTNAGLHRASHPGAGAITHQFGIHAEALDGVAPGSELTIYYGDFPFDPERNDYVAPQRDPMWLAENGWCIDYIEIHTASDPSMGRGAFVKQSVPGGTVIAPAPLQLFRDRSVFQDSIAEQLFVNYCFQPRNSSIMLFPFGQGVNLINHSRDAANVYLRWSAKSVTQMSWLDLSLDELFQVAKPGGLVLEVIALRSLEAGEELFLDYGAEWEDAWANHVATWKPVKGATGYVYPADMIEKSEPLRTLIEQRKEPYANNLATMCVVPERADPAEGGYRQVWREPTRSAWWQSMSFCHILDREKGLEGDDDVYTVSVLRGRRSYGPEASLAFDERIPPEDLFVETQVPRRAIFFVDKPYVDDEHLYNSFRHPILLPDELTPPAWKSVVS